MTRDTEAFKEAPELPTGICLSIVASSVSGDPNSLNGDEIVSL